ncbi:ATP-grasp domain-containing protein [Salibacterium halotolerans]|uniref:ATP-grasp domain-containing protein n=1 Tax=Salibacterium halotolerans TaxID=1884432 RepID=A0A1I5TD74_9BACI|nr:ATP-grasp domain-containing protein [Salibacterium halotolerans]SFP80970.1 ATP-grasp domain-containing protein [Salibacterium halotolerans]
MTSTQNDNQYKTALIGWSLPSIEAADELGRPFVIVGPPHCEQYAEKYDLPFIAWDFDHYKKHYSMEDVWEQSEELYQLLKEENTGLAVPLFEDTVEWAAAVNGRIKEDPKVFRHSLLFRHKGKMKRRALLGGLKVGVFEEANNKEEVKQFFRRVNDAMLKAGEEEQDPVHVKAFDKAGDVGHRIIRTEADIDALEDEAFPNLVESHLDGVEVSCEVFVHNGTIQFLNITEYIVFGYSMMAPPSPEIEKQRKKIRGAVQALIRAFDIQYGLIHPEFFIDEEGKISFIEVAARIPGGNIFDLIKKTYDFNPFQAHILCSDPNTSEEELQSFFPKERKSKGHAGSLMVYPRVKTIEKLHVPEELEEHPGFDRHTMFTPAQRKVPEMEGFGNPQGVVFFHHDNHDHVREPLRDYVDFDFYI